MRYPEEITLEVRNEEPDKKRRFTAAAGFVRGSKSGGEFSGALTGAIHESPFTSSCRQPCPS
jgi:hypothetical protein